MRDYTFDKLFKNLKKKYALSNAGLAVKIGVKPEAIRKYLRKERIPSNKTLKLVSEAFDIPLAYLQYLAGRDIKFLKLKQYIDLRNA